MVRRTLSHKRRSDVAESLKSLILLAWCGARKLSILPIIGVHLVSASARAVGLFRVDLPTGPASPPRPFGCSRYPLIVASPIIPGLVMFVGEFGIVFVAPAENSCLWLLDWEIVA